LVASVALAGEVFRGEDLDGRFASLELFQEPCANDAVLAWLKANLQLKLVPLFNRAVLRWKGKDWASCWLDVNGTVYSVDEEGSKFQPVPRAFFKDDSV
jgi:hypothetical protein